MNLRLKLPYNVQILNIASCGLMRFQHQPYYDVGKIDYTKLTKFVDQSNGVIQSKLNYLIIESRI